MVEEAFIPEEEHLKDTYTKTYRMQATGASGDTIRTSVPREVVAREARRRGMTITQFVKYFKVQWLYNGFEGAWAKFVPREEKDKFNATENNYKE